MSGTIGRRVVRSSICAAALMTSASFAAPAEAAPEKRVALVIGNSAYATVGTLDNPLLDAKAMSASLKRLGFQVVEGYDLTYDGMRRTVGEYAASLEGAKAALVYYAGHGVSVGGENYLLPTDTTLKSEADLDLKTINIDLVTRQMQREDRVSILILDACRNNPFKEELARSVSARTRSAGLGSGLSEISSKTSGMLIAFATDPGRTALDGERGGNSPFAAALLKHMETPDVSISTVLDRVRGDVFTATNGKQKPWTNTSLIGEFFLAKSGEAPKLQVANLGSTNIPLPFQLEMQFWDAAERSGKAEDYSEYLAKYPNGHFAQIAKNFVARLTPAPTGTKPAATTEVLAATAGTAETERAIRFTPVERREAAERLRAIGFFNGRSANAADFAPAVRAAIAEWQKSRDIPVTGFLTIAQTDALWDVSEADYRKMLAEGAAPVSVPRRVVNAPVEERVVVRPVVRPIREAAPVIRPVRQRPVQFQQFGGGGGGRGNAAAAAFIGGVVGGAIGGLRF